MVMCLWTASWASGSSGASAKGLRTLSHLNRVACRCKTSSSSGVKSRSRPPGAPQWTPCWATIKQCRSGRCRWQSAMLKCRSSCADPAAAAPCSARSSPRRGPSSAAREAGVRRPLDLAPPRRPGGLPRLLLSLTTARFAAQAAAVHLICPSRKSASSVRAAAGRRWERRSTDLEINCTDTTVNVSTTLRRSTTRRHARHPPHPDDDTRDRR
jgi:hypothetical protein